MKLDIKLKKKIKKKIKKLFFSGKKKLQIFFFFFFGKMKKNEKNNAEKRAFFLTKNPEIEKTEKSKKSNFTCLLCVHSKCFTIQLFDVMWFSKIFFRIF